MTAKTIGLVIVDEDPIFRLGFAAALENYADISVLAQLETASQTREQLRQQIPDLLILDPILGNLSGAKNAGWQLCQQLREEYPDLSIFLLSSNLELPQLLAAKASGIKGYCPKGSSIATLVGALRLVAGGQNYWQLSVSEKENKDFLLNQILRRNRWFARIRQSGLQQIESNVFEIDRRVEKSHSSTFDYFYWSGRKRELLAARWLVSRILPVQETAIEILNIQKANLLEEEKKQSELILQKTEASAIFGGRELAVSAIIDRTLAKIQSGSENFTDLVLEIDVLQSETRQELLILIVERLVEILEELRRLQVDFESLSERMDLILQKLWQTASVYFFNRYYRDSLAGDDNSLEVLLEDAVNIREYIITKIPLALELFAYLLFDRPLIIDNVAYRTESPESIERGEYLLQNLVVQIANGVMEINLNSFSESDISKLNLYNNQFRSSRAIAKFRNELSWKYRQIKYWEEPKNIFESQYSLFCLNGFGIRQKYIYAPRTEELNLLTGIPWIVTFVLETRDAIAPRLRAIIASVGNGIVYLLTQVVGRGIGLIGRGIIQGVGNSLQETKYGRSNGRGK